MKPWLDNAWRWWWLAPALVITLMLWCQLHGPVTGHPLVTFAESFPWAVKAAAGWLFCAALLARFGPAVLQSAPALRSRWSVRAALVAGIVVVTLGLEAWLNVPATGLLPWLYQRLPVHLLCAALLVGGCVFLNRAHALRPASRSGTTPPAMVEVMTGTGRTRIRLQDIECLEADRNYINVYTPQRSYLLRRTLNSMEKSLPADDFLRVHRSIIVNRAMIRERRHGGVLVLCSGRAVRVSRGFAHQNLEA
jgi:DNA-binding LytR/AlgR family response regulator